MRLRTRYALVLLGILLVLGTVVLGSAELFQQQTVAQEQDDLNETATLAAEQIDSAIDDQEDIVIRYAADPAFDHYNESGVLLNQLVDNSQFFAAQVIDEDGEIHDFRGEIDEEQRVAALGTDVSDREYVQSALTGTEAIAPPERIDEDGRVIVTITAPIRDESGEEVVGVLAASAPLETTDFFTATEPLETSSQTVQVTGTDSNGESAVLLEKRHEFDQPLTSQATVQRTGWVVEVERDRAPLTDRLDTLQAIQLGSFIIVVITVFGLGFYEYRTNLSQTEELLEGFEELTDGNFTHTVSTAAATEWEQIGEGFNTMASGIKEREEAIEERERRLSVLNRVLRHNLQNDMTVIQGYAEILPDAESRDRREMASEKILEKSQGLVDHGKKARQLETIMENAQEGRDTLDITDKTKQALSSYASEYSEFTFEIEAPSEAWVSAVSGVEFGIESLIENAFQHNDSDDPMMGITIRSDADWVYVDVIDNGSGVPEHEIEVLTQDEETSLEHGSGIGLWLSYWAAVKSDGELLFDSREEGGAIVTMKLPATDPPSEEEQAAATLDI